MAEHSSLPWKVEIAASFVAVRDSSGVVILSLPFAGFSGAAAPEPLLGSGEAAGVYNRKLVADVEFLVWCVNTSPANALGDLGLATMEARYADAARHISGDIDFDVETDDEGRVLHTLGDGEQSVAYLLLEDHDARRAVGLFLADTFRAVPALAARVNLLEGILDDAKSDAGLLSQARTPPDRTRENLRLAFEALRTIAFRRPPALPGRVASVADLADEISDLQKIARDAARKIGDVQ